MIVDQLKDCVLQTEWEIEGAESAAEALQLCREHQYCAIAISSTLQGDESVNLRRKLKTNPNTSRTPVIGLMVKGDDNALRIASDSGFSNFIFKPIEKSAALNVLYKVLSLDASDQYFDVIENILCFIVPSNLTTRLIDEIKASYAARIRNTINDGIERLIIDVSKVNEIGEDSVELVGDLAEELEEFGNPFEIGFVSLSNDADMWKNLDGCEEAEVFGTLEEAISGLSK